VGPFVFLASGETASHADFQLGIELMFLVESADDLLGVQNLVTLSELNIAGGDFAFLVHAKRKLARLVLSRLELDALQIQNDVGDVFDHAWQSGEFVLRAGNFYRGNGRAFQR